MTAALIKHGSRLAKEALFSATATGRSVEPQTQEPDEREIALAKLRGENTSLRDEIARLHSSWKDELAQAELRAREQAARAHVQDDVKRTEAMIAALSEARRQFSDGFISIAARSGAELALLALSKLVAARQNDVEWLAEVIARRLASLDDQSVIVLHLNPADIDLAESLSARGLPEKTRIESDPIVRAGTARIQLRLGEIEVDPVAGFALVKAVLAQGAADV